MAFILKRSFSDFWIASVGAPQRISGLSPINSIK